MQTSQVTIDVPRPKPGQKVYVYTVGDVLGGLGTIKMAAGNSINITEAPEVQYDWRMLVKDQLELVRLHGGSKVRARQQRSTSGRIRSVLSRR